MKTGMKALAGIAALTMTCALVPAAQAGINVRTPISMTTLAEADSMWVMKSAQGSLMEVELGKLAVQKAGNPAVIEYANTMINHHQTSYGELRVLAQRERMTFPNELNEDQEMMVDFFEDSTSVDWAKDYMHFQIVDHEKCIDETKDVIENGSDPQVKAQAAKTLPILEGHLRMAQDIYSRL